jgi:tRNA/tmRNA/rRNA uracil-C5-methylase (TrmA/RlmC/RlmD family)
MQYMLENARLDGLKCHPEFVSLSFVISFLLFSRPKYDPASYNSQLEVKAQLVREYFPEVEGNVEVLSSPPSNHRMRAKLGVAGADGDGSQLSFVNFEDGIINSLDIACEGICALMPLLLDALKAEPVSEKGT